MYKAALYYSQKLGWPVFPVHSVKNGQCSCGNVKCGNKGKHPRTLNGFYDATNDKAAVDQWWTRWPESNIGVPTGPLSGLAVLDVDVGHAKNVNGLETLAAHPELVVSTETGPAFSTGSGGMHVLYAYPEQGVTSGPTDLPGLEVKGSGGYIVVPPSTHAYGRDYAVLRWPHEHQVPAFPPALAAARARHKVTETAIPENGQKVPASARHGYLLSLGRRLCKSGLSRDSAFPALRAECNARCESPDEKGDLEIDSIIRWVWDKIEPDTPAAQTPPYGPIKSPLNPPSASATSAQSPAKHHAQLAVAFCESEHGHADGPTIRHYAGQFWWWRGGAYRPVSNDEIDASIYRFLPLDLISNAELVSGIRRALTYHVSLPASTDLPSWLNTETVAINGVTITAHTNTQANDQVDISGSNDADAANLALAINNSTTAGLKAVFATAATNVVTVTARKGGPSGNNITLASGQASVVANVARLASGAVPTTVVIANPTSATQTSGATSLSNGAGGAGTFVNINL